MVCRGCGLAVDMIALVDSGELDRRMNTRANGLADKAQALADENKDLLVENARLRRSLEKAGRK
jgi:regulator of replication initiation timing